MFAHQRVAKRRPVALVLPARIGHDPVKVVEHAGDEVTVVALLLVERGIDGQPIFAGQVGNDVLAVADRHAIVGDVGKLSARRRRGIEYVLMGEGQAGEAHKGKDLQPIAVVFGDAEQLGIRIEDDHELSSERSRMVGPGGRDNIE